MKSVEEKLADYLEILKQLHSEAKRDAENKELSYHSQTLATAEEYTLRNVINQLEKIK